MSLSTTVAAELQPADVYARPFPQGCLSEQLDQVDEIERTDRSLDIARPASYYEELRTLVRDAWLR